MAILASFGYGRLVLAVVARGFPNGVWRSSGQLGHFTGFHGNTIFMEVIGRRVPEPEPESRSRSRSRRAGAGAGAAGDGAGEWYKPGE